MNNQWNVGIVAFGFGEPASAHPNSNIGASASRIALLECAGFIFTDRDVIPHLRGDGLVFEEIDPKLMPTTYRLAKLAIDGAQRHALNELYVVAAPCHMWRCLRDLRWAADDCGVTITLTPEPIEGYQYDLSAETTHTRAAWIWWPLEIAYRIASSVFPKWYKRTRS